MNSISSDSDRDAVRDATDLARLIGEHVALRQQGREFVGLCPFHDDRTPSMHVVTHKGPGFYKCFACGAAGDCFRFVMDFHKMEFGQALRYLADRAGITLSPRSGQAASDGSARTLLKKISAAAERHFQAMLRDPELGAPGRETVERRGISHAVAEQFGIGYAPPGFSRLVDRLRSHPELTTAAIDAGLLRSRDERLYDTFRNRLIFPIRSEIGEPIAFGGRVVDPEDSPKYLNSPENPLFQKSRTLYALDLARRAIIDRRTAIVTEGYTDVIACHQAGFTNVVATLGTALTAEHGAILRRFCERVILLFDGDEAGRKAADRGIEVLLREPIDIRVCVLPGGVDPDELLRAPDGTAAFAQALESSRDATDYLLDRYRSRLQSADGLGARQRVAESLLDDLARMGLGDADGMRRTMLLDRVSSLLRVPLPEIEQAFRRRTRRRSIAEGLRRDVEHDPPVEAPSAGTTSRRRRRAEHDLAAIIILQPALLLETRVETTLETWSFEDPTAGAVIGAMLHQLRRDGNADRLNVAVILSDLPDDRTRSEAGDLFIEARNRFGEDAQALSAGLEAALEGLEACRRENRLLEQLVACRDAEQRGTDAAEALAALVRERRAHALTPAAIARHRRTRT